MQFQQFQALIFALAAAFISFSYQVSAIPTASHLKGRSSTEVRDGIVHTIFEHEPTNAKLDIVKNSGICETTPGVNQYSGYLSVGRKLSLCLTMHKS